MCSDSVAQPVTEMKPPPREVIAAARVVEQWASENNIKSWRIGALASRDELERAAARYAVARELGTEVWVERWAGMRRSTVTGAEFDVLVDRRIAASRLSFGEVIDAARASCTLNGVQPVENPPV